jgi:hypothetical protein
MVLQVFAFEFAVKSVEMAKMHIKPLDVCSIERTVLKRPKTRLSAGALEPRKQRSNAFAIERETHNRAHCAQATRDKIERIEPKKQQSNASVIKHETPRSSTLHISHKARIALAAIANSLAPWVSKCSYVRSIVPTTIDLTRGCTQAHP